MDPNVRDAIENHRLLELDYGGHHRIVEPHIYGEDSHGHALLSAYQVSGGSQSGDSSGWKLFDMERVADVQALPTHFHRPRSAYNPGDATFRHVYSQL